MPELPEVETIRRDLLPSVQGRRITAAWVSEQAPHLVQLFPPEEFCRHLQGRLIKDISWRASATSTPTKRFSPRAFAPRGLQTVYLKWRRRACMMPYAMCSGQRWAIAAPAFATTWTAGAGKAGTS